MNIKLFEYFIRVADEKNISRVAEQLFITQPTLSIQMKRLETAYGCKLFSRSIKGVELTPEGEVLLSYARNILRLYNQSFDEVSQLQQNRSVIRMDSNLTLSTWSLPCLIYSLQSNPDFQQYYFDMTFSTIESVESNILNGISDIGYVQNSKPHPDLVHYKVGEDRLAVVVKGDYDIPDSVHFADLVKYDLIYSFDKLVERPPLEKTLQKYGYYLKDFNIVMSLHAIEIVKTALYQGMGFSFLPYCSVKKEILAGSLKEIKVHGFSETYPIYLVYLKDNEEDPKMRPLIQYLKKSKTSEFC
ncbi:MAG: LysR family transcriptional regulator [Clostridiales bacterium]|nr:LysR family transcriptional regulator [Clostridiales bacterium]